MDGYIVYSRRKTGQRLAIRLEPCMEEIIDRYVDKTHADYLLPVITRADRDYTGYLRTYNKRLRRISAIMGFERPLSSYVSRHSWATLAQQKGVPLEIISKSMGHTSEKTTKIYLASLRQSVIDDANAKIIRIG